MLKLKIFAEKIFRSWRELKSPSVELKVKFFGYSYLGLFILMELDSHIKSKSLCDHCNKTYWFGDEFRNPKKYCNCDKLLNKQQIVLLGDGFLSRGFLDTIDKSKFKITQIYKDKFINPQDMIYQLNKDEWNANPLHLRDIIRQKPDHIIQTKIRDMRYNENTIYINEDGNDLMCDAMIDFDHLVIGLGSQKTLSDWEKQIQDLIHIKNTNIGIIGTGSTGIELATILSRNNNITLIDTLKKEDVLNYLPYDYKTWLLSFLEYKNISTLFNQNYNPNLHCFDKTIMCIDNNVNNLVSNVKLDDRLRNLDYQNVYMGGDCANTNLPKTAQLAYAQGVYIAKQINGKANKQAEDDDQENRPFHYDDSIMGSNRISEIIREINELPPEKRSEYYFCGGNSSTVPRAPHYKYITNGKSLNIGNNQNLIFGHPYIPDGIYPCELLKIYSMFIV